MTLTLSSAATTATSVNWTTANGTGVAGTDYVAASGKVTFAPGSLSATISVTVLGDGTVELDEIFKILLSNPVGLTLADNAALVTILNDDMASVAALSVADASIVEGNSGTNSVFVTVSLSAPSTTQVTVSYNTVAGTATGGTDYVNKSGMLTFAPGVTTQTISFTIIGDRIKEANETFQVVLSAASTTIARGAATVTIVDDERALTVSGTASPSQEETALTLKSASDAISAALEWWTGEGATTAVLRGATFVVTDLADGLLALADGDTVYLDADAAGFGWFLDATGRVTAGRIDLASVVIHELGHVLGLDHDDTSANSVMRDTLGAGARLVSESTSKAALTISETVTVADSVRSAYLDVSQGLRRGAAEMHEQSVVKLTNVSLPSVSAIAEPSRRDAPVVTNDAPVWHAEQGPTEVASSAPPAKNAPLMPDYDSNGIAQTGGTARYDPPGVKVRTIVLLDHAKTTDPSLYGKNSLAGGADDDMIFGGLGDDLPHVLAVQNGAGRAPVVRDVRKPVPDFRNLCLRSRWLSWLPP